ncbi:MAG: beta-ketoacyl-[acyl-carrier-protein] synthase family protein [Paludibacteraceae bacterium]|nr:beta-ketoacyl-[acyl-carrier-protein] synthase family protein [Paludibacteraceae bacterium]
MKRIVITGSGIVSSIGIGKQATLESLLREESGIGAMRILQSVHTHLPVGEVPLTDGELREQLSLDGPASRSALLGILAAREALEEAKIDEALLAKSAFISGTTVGGISTTEQDYREWALRRRTESIALHDAGATTETIVQALGPVAYQTTVSTACSSALNAIISGANMLKLGQYECVIAGGTESLSKFHLNGFHSLMILDNEPCRPFDDTRAGLNLGEGAAFVVLETEEAALRRGAPILAYVSGYGNACDAYHQTASSENGEGAYLAMRQALTMAHLEPERIDYVNAHGTATPNNDQSESNALMRVFGEHLPAVSSTKSMTGHTTSASGSVETVICLICMQYGFVPANVNFHTPMSNGVVPVAHIEQKELNHVMCNSFAFGGNDSSLILSRMPVPMPKEEYRELTLVRGPLTEIDHSGDYRQYISAMEARRMSEQMRRVIVAAYEALAQAGIAVPDAIITGTEYGCMTNTLHFLDPLCRDGEEGLKPTYFMQSTHNTVSSVVALLLKCHGYNSTFSHGAKSFDDARRDAENLLRLGLARNVLVLGFDEADERWNTMLALIGRSVENIAKAQVIKSEN